MKYRIILLTLAACVLAFPAQAQYRAATTCPGATALQPAGSSGAIALVDVNGNLCISGTVTSSLAGSTSNASSGVATGATNLPAVSYNYGFNGTTWDQLQVDASKSLKIIPSGQYPSGGVPITASATGTTGATVATLAAAVAKLTYICGFTITSDATAALAGTATITGPTGGTMSFIQNVGGATAAGILTQSFNPCIPSNATNTAIAVNSVAAGTGGNTAVVAWGFQL